MSDTPPGANVINGPYDTPAIRSGAIEYVKCTHCGAEPGQPCRLTITSPPGWSGKSLTGFAHSLRRVEYVEWQDIYGPATHCWEFVVPEIRARRATMEVIKTPPCRNPKQHCARCTMCECGVPLAEHSKPPAETPKKSNSDIDDLLG